MNKDAIKKYKKFKPITNPQTGNASRLIRYATMFVIGAAGLAGCGGDSGQNDAQSQNPQEVTLAATQTAILPPVLTDTVFAPSSFWYAAIPANAPLHANSAGFVADFLRQKQAHYGTVN
ncbi:MAG: hypothetical protein Q8Q81_02760, partial [Oxalobacteraceae bacterium]|nr:hypothetical protein [Oxalobacteraceae bacterium]